MICTRLGVHILEIEKGVYEKKNINTKNNIIQFDMCFSRGTNEVF